MKVHVNIPTLGKCAFYLKKLKVNIIVCKRLPMHLFMCTYFIFIVLINFSQNSCDWLIYIYNTLHYIILYWFPIIHS